MLKIFPLYLEVYRSIKISDFLSWPQFSMGHWKFQGSGRDRDLVPENFQSRDRVPEFFCPQDSPSSLKSRSCMMCPGLGSEFHNQSRFCSRYQISGIETAGTLPWKPTPDWNYGFWKL